MKFGRDAVLRRSASASADVSYAVGLDGRTITTTTCCNYSAPLLKITRFRKDTRAPI